MQNKLSWILITGFTICLILLIGGWFGIPYYVGNQVKKAVSSAGFAPGAVVTTSYGLQKVKVSNITMIVTSSPIVKKIYVPELVLDYDAASLLYGKASTIDIPTVEVLVAQPFTQFITSSGQPHKLNSANINALVKMLPKQKLIIHNLIIKNNNSANKLNNIFKMKLSLHPYLIRKGHYRVELTLDGINPKILIRDTSINGSNLHAKMSGTLLLEKNITFNGKIKLNAQALALPNTNLFFEKSAINGNIHVKNSDFVLKGKYQTNKFHILNVVFVNDPLALHGDFKITPEKVHVELQGNDEDGYLNGTGLIDGNTLSINATSTDFVTQNLNLQRPFSWLTQPIVFTQGMININGVIGLSSNAVTSLHVIGTNLGGHTSATTNFNGLNSNLEITKLNPFTTAPKQQLTITDFNPGLPLKNILVVYQVVPDPKNKILFEVMTSQAQFAGGTLTSNGFLYNPNDANHSALLNAHNISVADILKYTKVEGLTGTGTLNGTILFQWGVDGLQIKQGHLRGAGADNKITYIPPKTITFFKAQSPQLALVMNALKNFHYKNFIVTITSRGTETHLVAQLTGFNPDLYDGLPVNLNFTLTGELNLILNTILIGEQFKRQILNVASMPK